MKRVEHRFAFYLGSTQKSYFFLPKCLIRKNPTAVNIFLGGISQFLDMTFFSGCIVDQNILFLIKDFAKKYEMQLRIFSGANVVFCIQCLRTCITCEWHKVVNMFYVRWTWGYRLNAHMTSWTARSIQLFDTRRFTWSDGNDFIFFQIDR